MNSRQPLRIYSNVSAEFKVQEPRKVVKLKKCILRPNNLSKTKTETYGMETTSDGLSNEKYTTSWKVISEKVEEILNPERKTTMTFEPLYSRVYKNVCDGFSEQMHLDLITLCSRHLHGINKKLCSQDEVSVEHLLSVYHDLRAYVLSVQIISSIFSYLNKFYVVYYLNTDLFNELTGLFSQIIINERISTLMDIVEEALKKPFTIPPEVLHNFFNDLHQISSGEYSTKYFHLFSRYCPNISPPMKESDLENHIREIGELKKQMQRHSDGLLAEKHGVKRPADETVYVRSSCQQQKTYMSR